MKIALLGNMNNANFALLRFLKSRGLNADLLLWKNDGELSHFHFKPENEFFRADAQFVKRNQFRNSRRFDPKSLKNFIVPIRSYFELRPCGHQYSSWEEIGA